MENQTVTAPSFWGKDDLYDPKNDLTLRNADSTVSFVVMGFLAFGLINFIVRGVIPRTPFRSANTTHVVGSIHGIYATLAGLYCTLQYIHPFDSSPDGVMLTIHPTVRRVVAVTIGYFFYDLVNLVVYAKESFDILAIIHHVSLAAALSHGLAHRFATGWHCMLLITEASTPFVGVHHLLPAPKPGEKDPYAVVRVVNGVTLWATFIACRWVFNAFVAFSIVYTSFPSEWAPHGAFRDTALAPSWWVQTVFYVTSVVLNVWWGVLITRGMVKKVRGLMKGEEAPKAEGHAGVGEQTTAVEGGARVGRGEGEVKRRAGGGGGAIGFDELKEAEKVGFGASAGGGGCVASPKRRGVRED